MCAKVQCFPDYVVITLRERGWVAGERDSETRQKDRQTDSEKTEPETDRHRDGRKRRRRRWR